MTSTGSDDANLVSVNTYQTSTTHNSGQVFVPQDTPSQPPTSMTSEDEKSGLMGRFIEIAEENRWWYKAAVILFLNVMISYGICNYFWNNFENMTRIGWAAQKMGKQDVYVPIFIKDSEFKNLRRIDANAN